MGVLTLVELLLERRRECVCAVPLAASHPMWRQRSGNEGFHDCYTQPYAQTANTLTTILRGSALLYGRHSFPFQMPSPSLWRHEDVPDTHPQHTCAS